MLKVHDICPNPKCKCHKPITFSSGYFEKWGAAFKTYFQNNSKGTQAVRNNFLKHAVNVAAPFIGIVVAAKSKNPQVGQATTIVFNSMSSGRILNVTDMHGNGLRLKIMWI